MQRAVRTSADALLRTVRDDRHFGAIDEDPLPERPSTEPRYTRLSPEKRLRLAVLGDEIRVVGRPNQGLSVRDVFRIYSRDRQEAGRLLAVPGMSESWKAWAQALLRRAGSGTMSAPDPGCC